jgi:hypothetical protein
VSRRINDEYLQQAIKDGKLDPRGTREARRQGMSSAEPEVDHPLIAQGKAMQDVAEKLGAQGKIMENIIRELASAQKSKDSGIGATLAALMTLIGQNNALVKQMMTDMAEMHKNRLIMAEKKPKIKIIDMKVTNRTQDRLIDTMRFTVEAEE